MSDNPFDAVGAAARKKLGIRNRDDDWGDPPKPPPVDPLEKPDEIAEADEQMPAPVALGDLSDIDLLAPPGLVGVLTKWINNQSRFERANLAVGAALFCVGNIGGLHFEDDFGGVTSNTTFFGLAASATGKDAIIKAITKAHIVVGRKRCVYGRIMSTQELMRNLVEHQQSIYTMDEVDALFASVKAANTKGGASHNAGIWSEYMNIFTKADAEAILGGTDARLLEKRFSDEFSKASAQIEKLKDKTPTDPVEKEKQGSQIAYFSHQRDQAEVARKMVSEGLLQNPFLSLFGFAIEDSFFKYMDVVAAAQGLLGRSLILQETDDYPDGHFGQFKKEPMPFGLEIALKALANGGTAQTEVFAGRIENYGDRVKVTASKEITDLLEEIARWWWKYAETLQGIVGGIGGRAIGAVARRSNEMMQKIVFILAMGSDDHAKTLEHIRWAFAFIAEDLGRKFRVIITQVNRDNPNQTPDTRLAAMTSDVMNKLPMVNQKSAGWPLSKIKREYNKASSDLVTKAVETLEKAGKIVALPDGQKRNGKPTLRYYRAKRA